MTIERDPGASWLRCDLHVHTPFDGEKKFGEDIRAAIEALKKEKPARLAEIAERFVEACRSAADGKGVDLVALTDHNSIAGYKYLRQQFEAIAQQARDQAKLMPTILPGVEFTVGGERPLHFLVIFEAGTNPEQIEGAIRHVFGSREPFDKKTGVPQATGNSVEDFIKKLYDWCNPSSGDRDICFVLLPAHADSKRGIGRETGAGDSLAVSTSLWDEMKGHLRQWVVTRTDWNGFETVRPFAELPQAFRDLLIRWAAARREEDWDKLSEARKERYRRQAHWPLVQCSDPHQYEAIGSRYTWLKMEVPDIEGIRIALLDPESRLRLMADGPPGRAYPQIRRVGIRGTDFYGSIEIPINPCLTTVIGGRGSGKSTVIEYARYALDHARDEDFAAEGEGEIRERVTKLLGSKPSRDFGETPGTLLPDHQIEVGLLVSNREYLVRRTAAGIEVIPDPQDSAAKSAPLDVRVLITPRILSQRQIAQIARDPAAQRRELDALLEPGRLRTYDEKRREALERLAGQQAQRKSLKERAKRLPARETELRKIDDQIAFLEAGGKKDTFAKFGAYQGEDSWVNELRKELERIGSSLEEEATGVEQTRTGLSAAPPGPTHDWTAGVETSAKALLESIAGAAREQSDAVRRHLEALIKDQERIWTPGFEAARREYQQLSDEMREKGVQLAEHEKLLGQRAALRREVQELRQIGPDLEKTEREMREARKNLLEAHEERLRWRRERAGALETAGSDVRLEVLPFQDARDLAASREAWFGGAGLQTRDWEVLLEYVRGSNGSIPERLSALAWALREDLEKAEAATQALAADSSSVAALLGEALAGRLTRNFFNALLNADRIRVDELERFLPEDAIEARVRATDGNFKPLAQGSIGQRSTAMLSLLLSSGDQPLIIDQPEDDLDNQYIYDVVVDLLRKRKFSRQIIITTHNANIPVNGDAELIVALGVSEKERIGTVLAKGSIDNTSVKEHVSVIMEGSAEAFRLRRERYGF